MVTLVVKDTFVFPAHQEPVILHFMILEMATGAIFNEGGVLELTPTFGRYIGVIIFFINVSFAKSLSKKVRRR